MKRNVLLALSFSFLYGLGEIFAQTPQISTGGVVNTASYARPGVLAPGVIFSVFGTSLTDGSTVSATQTPLPTRLAGARVLVNGVAASLFFASPLQINGQFPVELAGLATAMVQVEVQTAAGLATTPPVSVAVESVSPGIFTRDQNGSGPGAILRNTDFSNICPPGRANCQTNRAVRGEVIAIYMTGLGQVNGPWSSGRPAEAASPSVITPIVRIGTIQVPVLFSGLAAGFVGLYQVNVRVPDDAPIGDNVPLTVSISSRTSNPVTIAIAIAPPVEIPLTLYAGTAGGVFKSTNGGASWTAANSGLSNTNILSLAIDPTNPDVVFAGTSPGPAPCGGIFKSTDGGASWTATTLDVFSVGLPVCFIAIRSLAFDPRNTSTIYAATSSGILKTINGGTTWREATAGLDFSSTSLAIDPSAPATIYAGAYRPLTVLKSMDGALSWFPINNGLTFQGNPVQDILSLAIDPANSSTVYAGAGIYGIFKSTDGGESWTRTGAPLTTFYRTLAIDPTNPATVFAGNTLDGILKSTNGGASWTLVRRAVVFTLAIDPANPATVFAGGSRGVLQTTNGGVSWTDANVGLANQVVQILTIAPRNPAIP